MRRHVLVLILLVFGYFSKAQCPLIYDYLGNLTANPTFVSCTGNAYALNFQSNSNWGAYTINWGDGTPNNVGASYTANSIISHTYAATTNTFAITLTIPSQSCVLTGFVAMEQPVFAGIVVAGGVALACAPKTLTFTNVSTFTSATTSYTWNFGDGSPLEVYTFTNAGQNVTHTYQKGTVNCQTQVILQAMNYCTFGAPTSGQVNPLYVYDIDDAAITPDQVVRCWPDNTFQFTNTTARNCVPQGNTFQRQEYWNLGDHWGLGRDSIIDWSPWPPTTPISISYTAVGNYTVTLLDSNQCGIDPATIVVSIENPPTASLVAPTGNLCQNTAVTFTNLSSTGPGIIYRWNFDDGGGFTTLAGGTRTYNYPSPGTYTVQLVALINGGGGACSDTSRAVITILASPVANFSFTPAQGCNSLSGVSFTDLSTGASTYSWNFGNGNTSTLVAPPPQNYLLPNTYSPNLVVTATTGCTNSRTHTIIVRPNPLPDFPAFSACVGSGVTFTNNSLPTNGANAITNYTWHFGDGTLASNSVVPVHTYTAASNYTVKLIAASAFCIDSIAKTVTVNIQPTALFAISPTLACPPLAASFTNNSLNGLNYLWKFGTSASATSTAVNPTFTYNNNTQNPITYTVTLYTSTGIGCTDSIKNTVTVSPLPIAGFTANINAGCSPFLTTFTNTSQGATTYSWNFGDGSVSIQTNPVHTYTNTSLFQQTVNVQMIATSSVGCVNIFTSSLIVYAKPDVSITMVPSSGCHPLVVLFPPVPGVASYTWSHGDGSPQLITTTAPHSHTFANFGIGNQTFTVSLIASNVSGCVDSARGNVIVFPKPTANILISPTVGCSPLNTVLSSTTSLNNNTYFWKFGDGTTASSGVLPTTNHTYTNSSSTSNQNYTTSLVVTSVNGCKDSIGQNLLVYYKPEAKFLIDTPRCVSQTINFTNQSVGSFSQTWSFGDGSAQSTSVNAIHNYTNTGINNSSFTAQLIVSSIFNCKDTAIGTPIIYAKPISNFIRADTAGCSPLLTNLVFNGLNAHNYLWRFGDGATSVLQNANHTYTNTSDTLDQFFNTKLIVYNNNGCRDSITKPIRVFYKPFANFTLDTPACSPKTITFENKSIGGTSFKWNFGNGGNSTATSTVAQNYSHNSPGNVVYTVSLVTRTPNSCTDVISIPVVVHPKPNYFILAQPDSGCNPLTVSFPKISDAVNYFWTFEPGNFSEKGDVVNTFANTGSGAKIFTVQLIASNIYKCSDTATKLITVYPKPIARFTASPLKVYIPNQATKCFNLSSGANRFYWTFGDGGFSEEREPSHTYKEVGEYQIVLAASNEFNCADTAYLAEKVLAEGETFLEVPNAFTPNLSGPVGSLYDPADRSNDIFHPNVRGADQYQFSVYSRWGELLFDTKNPLEGWDGYYKGKLCVQEVYVWKIVATFLDGKKIVKTGDVLLLR